MEDSTNHGLRTPREEIAFTARPKIQSQSQIFRYGRSIFCLPHRPNFSDIFDLCIHWVSVVRAHLESIRYHSEPSVIPYSPNQFLGWDFSAVSYSKPALKNQRETSFHAVCYSNKNILCISCSLLGF